MIHLYLKHMCAVVMIPIHVIINDVCGYGTEQQVTPHCGRHTKNDYDKNVSYFQ